MGQHLGKPLSVSKGSSTGSDQMSAESPEAQDEVFGEGEADLNQNNGSSSKSLSESTPEQSSGTTPDPDGPRPHLTRLFSRDAPGREDNTFTDRPSESDELQTIQEDLE
ncbi:myelin basic protein-like [Pimephales promelas]|uniref:myelin basic protein-like n=1 Tax=Pimephales promelas TaxID=90988 RepID=UPI001955EF0A|nr:myelin basic protein-like [Pimephales promelas]